MNITFHPTDPIVVLYRPIKRLQKLVTTEGIPYLQVPQLEFGLTLIRNMRDLEKAFGEWSVKPDADKTWDNFKINFKQDQAKLKKIRGPKMNQAGYHHANMFATQLRAAHMLAMVQQYNNTEE